MKALHYFWITIMALLSVLTLSCEPEPEPEPPRHEMPDPYIIPKPSDHFRPYNKIEGRWVFCGGSTNADVKPNCLTPLFPHQYDTLRFTADSLFYLNSNSDYFYYYSCTDSILHYGRNPSNMTYSKKVEFRNNDKELLIRDWIAGDSHLAWACYHNIDRGGW
ncbi:MAG: hypothetical protein J6T59_06000 [Bacteroidales bacterium]|nr:hypothetical protein [Bacteroidales bacterium]